jgi:hypothetical protein
VLKQITSGGLTVIDSSGVRFLVRAGAGVKIQLKGRAAPTQAVFPGVQVKAKGRLSNGTLIASSISITVAERTVSGRAGHVSGGRFVIAASRSSSWTVDTTAGPSFVDGGKRLALSVLRSGAYLRAGGYVESPGTLRAVHIEVMHPQLSISATVISVSGGLVVQTTQGDRYTLKLTPATVISAGRAQVQLALADIPAGVKVRIQGTVRVDGLFLVSRLTVNLPSFTVRGQVTRIVTSIITVQAAGGSIQIKIGTQTTFFQTSHQIKLSDIVVGDDVTVYGYSASTVLARKILVHRKRLTVSGTVEALTADGLTLQAVDGPHHILVSSATVLIAAAGQQIAVGMVVRVTGYLRGDGVILAIRITITSKAKP